jgi:hypothetical protein
MPERNAAISRASTTGTPLMCELQVGTFGTRGVRFDRDASAAHFQHPKRSARDQEHVAHAQTRSEVLVDLTDRARAARTHEHLRLVRDRADVLEERGADVASEPVDRRLVGSQPAHVRLVRSDSAAGQVRDDAAQVGLAQVAIRLRAARERERIRDRNRRS